MAEGDGAVRDYSLNPSKAHWRRTAWNFIAEHSRPIAPGEMRKLVRHTGFGVINGAGIGLCLVGRQGLDLPVAARKGIDVRAIVGVERDRMAIKEIRKRGIVCIPGELEVVRRAWSRSCPISWIMADQCGPMDLNSGNLVMDLILGLGWTSRRCLVINALRGRESGVWKDKLVGYHRGAALLDIIREQIPDLDVRGGDFESAFHSYRSGGLVYDSLMIGGVGPAGGMGEQLSAYVRTAILHGRPEEAKRAMEMYAPQLRALGVDIAREREEEGDPDYGDPAVKRTERRINAALALLTMRGVQWRERKELALR